MAMAGMSKSCFFLKSKYARTTLSPIFHSMSSHDETSTCCWTQPGTVGLNSGKSSLFNSAAIVSGKMFTLSVKTDKYFVVGISKDRFAATIISGNLVVNIAGMVWFTDGKF